MPAWSPDGNKIAFARDGQVWIMNSDGSNQSPITWGGYVNQHPSWQRLPEPTSDTVWIPAADMNINITCGDMRFEFYTDSQGALTGNIAYMGLNPPTLPDLQTINIQIDGKDYRIEIEHWGLGYITITP